MCIAVRYAHQIVSLVSFILSANTYCTSLPILAVRCLAWQEMNMAAICTYGWLGYAQMLIVFCFWLVFKPNEHRNQT